MIMYVSPFDGLEVPPWVPLQLFSFFLFLIVFLSTGVFCIPNFSLVLECFVFPTFSLVLECIVFLTLA